LPQQHQTAGTQHCPQQDGHDIMKFGVRRPPGIEKVGFIPVGQETAYSRKAYRRHQDPAPHLVPFHEKLRF
jgi:hypothetical protein